MTQNDTPPIDHHKLAEDHWADRYLLGQLSAEEALWYENHFPTCEGCLEELEVAEALRETVRRVETGPQLVPEQPTKIQGGGPDWKWLGLGMAAGLVLGLLVPFLTTKDPVPVLDVTTFALISERTSSTTLEAVTFRSNDAMVALNVPVPSSPHGYLVVMRNHGTQEVYRAEMAPATGNQKWILLQKRHFPPGIYTLDVEVLDAQKNGTLYSQHQFEVSHVNGA